MVKKPTYVHIPGFLSAAGIPVPAWMSSALDDASLRYTPEDTTRLVDRVLTTSAVNFQKAGRELNDGLLQGVFVAQVNAIAEQRGQTIIAREFTVDRLDDVADSIRDRFTVVAKDFTSAAHGVTDVSDVSPNDVTSEMIESRDKMTRSVEPLRRTVAAWKAVAPLAGIDLTPMVEDLGAEILAVGSFPTMADLEAAAVTISRHRQFPSNFLYSRFSPYLGILLHNGTLRLADAETMDDERVALYRATEVAA